MTAVSKKTPPKTSPEPPFEQTLNGLMLAFRADHASKIETDKLNAVEIVAALVELYAREGFNFVAREVSVRESSNGGFLCTYNFSVVHTSADDGVPHAEYKYGAYTVQGSPMFARLTATDMAMIDFAGMNRQVAEAVTRPDAPPEPVAPPMPDPGSVAPRMPEQEEHAPAPSPELQRALSGAVESRAETPLVESRTSDGIPVLEDLFEVEGNTDEIANQAADIFSQTITTAPNTPTLRALWNRNESNLNYVKDYAPDRFNDILQLSKQRRDVLDAETEVLEHPGKQAEGVLKPVRKPRARQRRVS